MAIKNSQSKRMALANMLKQRPIYNQRMANFMSPTGALGGLPSLTNPGNVPQNTGINQLLRPAQSSLSNIYNPSVQPTGPTGLTSNFYDPSYGIDRGFADQMTARNKAMQGMDSGQIQYDPVNKSFFSVGAMGQRGGPALQGTYDQMYRQYDMNNQLRGLGTPSSLTPMQQAEVAQAGTNPFNAAQIDFMNKNQDVFGGGSIKPMTSQPNTTQPPEFQLPFSSPASVRPTQTGLSQPTQDQSVRPPLGGGYGQQATRYISPEERNSMEAYYRQDGINQANRPRVSDTPEQQAYANQMIASKGQGIGQQPIAGQPSAPVGGYANSGKVNQSMPSTGYPKINEAGFGDARGFANMPKMNDTGFGDARGYANNGVTSANIGQATQNYPKQRQAPARRPVNRGKLNQLMPTPGV